MRLHIPPAFLSLGQKSFFSPFTMQLYGALVLLVTVSAVCGLQCYTCGYMSGRLDCTNVMTCTAEQDACVSFTEKGRIAKGCGFSCERSNCCKGDLCNGAIPSGSSVLLLLVSSATMTVFL